MRRRIAAGAAVLAFGVAGVAMTSAPASAATPSPTNPLGCDIGVYLYLPTPVPLVCLHV